MAYWPAAQRRPSTLDYILKGLDTAMGVANFVGQMKTRQTAREGAGLDQTKKQLELIKEINPDQDVSLPGDIGSKLAKLGVLQPQASPEMAQAQGAAIKQQFAPEGSPEGSLSSPDTETARAQAATDATKGMTPSYILPARKQKVGILSREGTFTTQDVPAGVTHFMSQPTPATSHGVYDPKTGKYTETPGVPTVLKSASPAKPIPIQVGDQVKYFLPTDEGLKPIEGAGGPKFKPEAETTLLDRDYGLPVGQVKGKGMFLPAPKEQPGATETVRNTTYEQSPLGPVSSQTITSKRPSQAKTPQSSGEGFTIPGLGTIQRLPNPGEGINLKGGGKVENHGGFLMVTKPDGTTQKLALPTQ